MATQAAPGGAPPSAAPKTGQTSSAARILKRPLGPFPVWVWLAVVGALLGWRLYDARKGGTSASSGTASMGDTATSGDTGVPADQVPQFVNQTYTTVTAPSAPTPASPAPTPATTPIPNPAHPASQYAKPTGLTAKVSGKSATIMWNLSGQPSPAPGSYTVAVYNAKGKDIATQTVSVPDTTGGRGTVTIPNLPAGPLHVNVWANGGKVAPQHATANFTVR